MNDFVISISGHGECGKDTVAPILSQLLGIPYKKSTSSCVVDPWWHEIQLGIWSKGEQKPEGMEDIVIEPGDYSSSEEFYEGRRHRRMDWVAYIEHYNLTNGEHGIGLYEKAIQDDNHILTGIRRTGQFKRCLEHLIDVAIWVDKKDAPIDESQEYGPELCNYVLDNNGTLNDLHKNCVDLSYSILSCLEHGDFITDWIIDRLEFTSKCIIEGDKHIV